MAVAIKKKFEQTVTDVAVLQLEVRNLHDKVDELKSDVKDLHECLDRNMIETRIFLKGFQEETQKQHEEHPPKTSMDPTQRILPK